jgi:rhomboid protease GluP
VARERKAVLCGKCRQLISNQESKCPYCGALQPNTFGLGGKLWAFFRDDFDPVFVLMVMCGVVWLLGVVWDPAAALDLKDWMRIGSPSSRAMLLLGSAGGGAWQCGHVWTILTANLIHAGLIHLGFNLYFLHFMGPQAVELLGPGRTTVLFFLGGAGGMLVASVMSPAPVVGASAGLFALLGGLATFGWRRGGTFGAQIKKSMLTTAAMVTIYSLFFGGVSHWAHGGGLVFGALVALAFPKHEGRHESRNVQLLALALLVLTVGAMVLNVVLMLGPVTAAVPRCPLR